MNETNKDVSSPKILSGTIARDQLLPRLIEAFQKMKLVPELAIIQVGNRADSTSYIKGKTAFAEKVGVMAHHIHLTEDVTKEVLISEIKKLNSNPAIQGIILQLPLPAQIDRDIAIDTIDPCKDIDGLTSIQVMHLSEGRPDAIVPATARGVMDLLSFYNINPKGKKITVVGRSALVGRPLAQLFRNAGATVTVAHSKTVDLATETRSADILVVAVGKANLITVQHVKPGQIIIDVGINRVDRVDDIAGAATKLVGDVDFGSVSKIVGPTGAITPVPGGVGPMTVVALFENLADVCKQNTK